MFCEGFVYFQFAKKLHLDQKDGSTVKEDLNVMFQQILVSIKSE